MRVTKPGCFTTFALVVNVILIAHCDAGIVTFGSGLNQFDMEFVEIGKPGNTPDATGNPSTDGSLSYVYKMAKYEVSRDMITKANSLGEIGITMWDMTPFNANGPNKPATGVSWNEAARFVNWLNTSTGNHVAYKFPNDDPNETIFLWEETDLGFNPSNPFRNSLAKYVLPSSEEWQKAAHYDPVSDTWFDYPNGKNTPPTPVAGGTEQDTAVYDRQSGPADVTNAGGLSPYGVMGLGGNVYEWNETERYLSNTNRQSGRIVRGGDWGMWHYSLLSTTDFGRGTKPWDSGFSIGFRVVSLSSTTSAVPEPSAMWLTCILFATCLCCPSLRSRFHLMKTD